MVSNWKAYVLSYAAHGTTVWLFVSKTDGLDLDSSVWVAKVAGMIMAGMTFGAIIQTITEGQGRKQFQYFLLPVSASQLAKYRIIRVLPFVMPPLLFWFIVIMRESSWQLYGIHWAFPALLGWICAGEAVVNVMRDRWPRHWFIAITSFQWILLDLASRSHRRFAADYVWITCFFIGSCVLIWGRLDPVLSLLVKGSGLIGAWAAAVTASSLSVLSFRRRRSFGSWEPGAQGAQRASRLVRPGRLASLTILLNDIVSNWKAYVASYAGLGAMFWWLLAQKEDAFDLENPIMVARIAAPIVASTTLGAVVQGITDGGEHSNSSTSSFRFPLRRWRGTGSSECCLSWYHSSCSGLS